MAKPRDKKTDRKGLKKKKSVLREWIEAIIFAGIAAIIIRTFSHRDLPHSI